MGNNLLFFWGAYYDSFEQRDRCREPQWLVSLTYESMDDMMFLVGIILSSIYNANNDDILNGPETYLFVEKKEWSYAKHPF